MALPGVTTETRPEAAGRRRRPAAAALGVGGLGRRAAARPAPVRPRPAHRGQLLEERLAELNGELEGRGLAFRPHFWLSDEWFSPTACPASPSPSTSPTPAWPARAEPDARGRGRHARVVPAHPAPRGGPRDRERLPPAPRRRRQAPLRPHLACRTRSSTRRGPTARATSSTSTPGTRRAIPTRTSRRRSRSGSRRARTGATRYAGWPALRKLEYVDELMARARAGRAAGRVAPQRSDAALARCASTLRKHYAQQARALRRRAARRSTTATCAGSSRDAPSTRTAMSAARFLAPHPAARCAGVVRVWTGEYQYSDRPGAAGA